MRNFNETNGCSNFIRRASNKFLATTAITAVTLMGLSGESKAADDWTGHTQIGGSVGSSISYDPAPPANTTNITQLGHRVKVSGDGDIKAGWTVNLTQDTSSSQYILFDNEISDPTRFIGDLNANGEVFIFDQDGVIFGANSNVNVGSIVASSGNLASTDAQLDAGTIIIDTIAGGGDVINNGTITVADAGLAAFVAPNVTNNGVINAKVGTVALAAGEIVTLDMYGDGLFEVAVDGELSSGLVENTNAINARGGVVAVSAAVAKDAVDHVINMGGTTIVSSTEVRGGKIILNGGESGRVNVTGKLRSYGGGTQDSGSIDISGQTVKIANTAEVRANAAPANAAGDITIAADTQVQILGEVSTIGRDGTGSVTVKRTTEGEIGLGDTSPLGVRLIQNELNRINTETLIVGGENTTGIKVTGIDITSAGIKGDLVLRAEGTDGKINVTGNSLLNGLVARAEDDIVVEAGSTTDILGGSIDIETQNGADIAGMLRTDGGDIGILSYSTVKANKVSVLNTGALVSNGGNINIDSNGPLNIGLGGSLDILGTVDARGTASDGDVALNGNLIGLGANSEVYGDEVSFTGGAVVQQSTGSLIAETITGSLSFYARLRGTGNDITNIGDFATGLNASNPGGFELDNSRTSRSYVAGNVTTNGGAIDIDTAARLDVDGSLVSNGGDIILDVNTNDLLVIDGVIDSGNGKTDLSSGTNILLRGDVTANELALTSGNIVSQTVGSTIIATTLTGNVDKYASFLSANNDITNIGDFATGLSPFDGGGFTLIDSANGLNITGALSTQGGDIDLTTTGDLNVQSAGSLITEGGNLALTSNTLVDIDLGATVDLDTGDAHIDSPLVNLGDDIDTTGTITGTANIVNVESAAAQIQDGVDVAASGGRVNLAADTYAESVNINKVITVAGDKKTNTFITPGVGKNGFTIDGVIDGNVTLLKMNISGGEDGVHVKDTADVKGLVINKVDFVDNALRGVAVFGNSVDATVIKNANFLNNGIGSTSNGDGDILFYLYNGNINLQNVDIQGNTGAAADYGIQIRGADTLAQSGKLKFTNVKVAGDYRAAQLGIQKYDGVRSLAMTNVVIGGTTDAGTLSSNAGGFGAVYLENLGSGDLDFGNIEFAEMDPALRYLTNYTFQNIDATGATFEGVAAADATVEESFAIEDRIVHKMDFAPLGLVTWQDGNVFVTSNTAGIQNAINIANAGDTVNVDDSTYTEDLLIDKELKLTGHGTTLESAGGANLITVTASNVNIDPFTFDGAGLADYGVNANGLGAIGLTVDGNTFKNFKKAGVFVAANGVGTGSIINNTFEGSSNRGVDTGTLDGGYTLDITDNIIGTNGDKVKTGVAFGTLRNATVNISGGSMDTSGDAISGGNVGSNVALNLTNLDIEAGDEAIDFNGNVDGHVTISGGTLIGAGSGFEANFIGGNGVLDIKDGARVEGTHATHGYGLNILRAGINGAINVVDSTIKGGFTGIGSDGGVMDVNGSLSVSGGSVEGVNGDGINIADVNGAVSVSDGADIKGAQNGIIVEGTVDGGTFDVASSTVTGTNANGIEIAVVTNGATVDISDNINIEGALNGVGVNNISGTSSVTIDNNIIEAGLNGVFVTGLNPSVDGDALVDVTNNTIDNKNIGIIADGISDLDISDNVIDGGTGKNGIIARDSGDVSITGNTANNNVDTAGRPASSYKTGIGILVDNASGEVEVSDNTANNNDDGIRILNTDAAALGDVVVKDNITNDNLDKGIIINRSDNVEVSGNTIERNKTGIWLEASSNGLVDDNEINDSTENAIRLRNGSDENILSNNRINGAGDNGILVAQNSDDVNITNNTINNVDDNGVLLDGSKDAVIEDNKIGLLGTIGGDGILLDNGSTDGVVHNNQVSNATNGIKVTGSSTGADITDNTVSNSSNHGIVAGSLTELVTGNTVTASGNDGIAVINSAGIDVSSNDVTESGHDGISVVDSDGANVEGNTVEDSGDHGINILTSADVNIINNDITNAGIDGIHVENSDSVNIDDNDIYATAGGVFGSSPATDGAGRHGIFVSGGEDATINNNRIKGDAGFFAYTGLGAIVDGIHVEDNANVEVTNNDILGDLGLPPVGAVGGNGIYVGNSDEALVEGNTVAGTGSHGIYVSNSDDAEILTNNVSFAGGHGVKVSGSRNSLIDGNEISGAGIDGINVSDSNSVRVLWNKVLGKATASVFNPFANSTVGAARDGIHIEDSNNAVVDNNTIQGDSQRFRKSAIGAGRHGIFVSGAQNILFGNGAQITNNNILGDDNADSVVADGIHVEDNNGGIFGLRTKVAGNTIEKTGENGIFANNTQAIIVDDNDINETGENGVVVSDSWFAQISENDIHSTGNDGIKVNNGRYASIIENHVHRVGDDGIDVDGNYKVDINDNTIKNTGLARRNRDGNGIEVSGSFDADIRDNYIEYAGDDGIDVEDSAYADIRGNEVRNSGDDGIDVEGSRFVDINDNHIHGARGDGIEVTNSFDADVIGNRIHFVGDDGIYARNNFGADIRFNNIHDARRDGIDVEDSNFVDVNFNTVNRVGGNGIEVQNSDHADIIGNRVSRARENGIYVNPSDFVNIGFNRIFFSGENGIDVNGGHNINIFRNLVGFNGRDGINVDGSRSVDVLNNISFANRGDGIDVNANHFGRHRGPNEINIVGNRTNYNGDNGIEVSGDRNVNSIDLLIDSNTTNENGDNGIEIIADAGFFGPSPRINRVSLVPGEFNSVVSNNIVENNTNNGLYVAGGGHDNVEVSGNTFTENDIGAFFESGNIDLTGDGNLFNGGRVGMRFAPAIIGYDFPVITTTAFSPLIFGGDPIYADMSLVDNTIGAQTFDGQTESYVELDNGAFFNPGTPTLLNALDSTYVGTPFGTVTPSSDFAAGFTPAQLAYFESKFYHFNDDGSLGLFFFPLLPEIDQEDILRYFGPNAAALAGLSVTILGLPTIPGGAPVALNNIAPAAGGDPTSPEALNAIATAAGGDGGSSSTCFGDALNIAGSGQAATVSYGGSAEDLLNSEAGCGS